MKMFFAYKILTLLDNINMNEVWITFRFLNNHWITPGSTARITSSDLFSVEGQQTQA